MDINGKVAWVTGGTTGMGFATAKMLLEKGAKVMITSRRQEMGDKAIAELNAGDNCFYLCADMMNHEALEKAVNAVIERWGRLDILIANAGGGTGGYSWTVPMDLDMEAMQRGEMKWTYSKEGPGSLEIFSKDVYMNLIANFDAARLSAWEMLKNEPDEIGQRGCIIFTSSISATKRHDRGVTTGYAAGKAGLLGLTKEMAVNLADGGIRVNSILPGYFQTEMMKSAPESMLQPFIDAQIFPKVAGDPKYIGQMMIAVVENDFVNNATIEVTAGFSAIPAP